MVLGDLQVKLRLIFIHVLLGFLKRVPNSEYLKSKLYVSKGPGSVCPKSQALCVQGPSIAQDGPLSDEDDEEHGQQHVVKEKCAIYQQEGEGAPATPPALGILHLGASGLAQADRGSEAQRLIWQHDTVCGARTHPVAPGVTR
ncbi:hypothetical protein EVAR_88889_1 [Eumeta japonica]|uniref:Uncharacterized protein n=1 Tax=Eumeta variegata TaxID=151549 RepID=A0A4C1XZY7_EUMVA|nr:hypothetical protein EVAR_88889_1 [Eumeta japonica]